MPYTYEPEHLAGKNVLLTGGTTGIGRATAYRLIAAGANVLIFGRHEQELNDALEEIRRDNPVEGGSGQLYGVIADQSKPEEVERVFREIDSRLGFLDILVNNAALGAGSILESNYADWEEVIQTNLLGYMHCCRLAIDRFKEKRQGHIINVGSLSAKVREAGSDIYVATKSGIEGFTEALRKQVNELGIKVTLIEPGLVATDMTTDQVPEDQQPEKIAEGTMLRAEEIAESVYYALIQPRRCDVILIQIRPHGQSI